ncbi:5-methyltetrahydropteroyltriglutamate--homocysteine S-methyltransferase [Ammoniphilus oxalaticus]|uniref:5-methyltetrahydropteroyltriglutamate--homocysteine methyltransferase n=1 Tax=Ammoniphilus oxalaticus TaxID=66863 RepID=A0A419SNS2_9BACL|nr:5-methyltetrahydropteroyltriglutamate--homocysteine S-methyltransferase [Ammoniphilus oxalaticus]RKD25954.1 5-methyltetrahydropteroyltriglutamate--homocysteine S-methyltransferase [Ammoniphilus oxalaticus]
MSVLSSNLGYPRIGEDREWKRALESFWAGELTEEQFEFEMKQLRLRHIQKQKEKQVNLIPVGDFTYYDQVLDLAVMFGLVPERFNYEGGPVSLETYYAMARGNQDAVACEMTKWFNTNYHYIVPEYKSGNLNLTENKPLKAYREARDELGVRGKPVLIGPYTFLKLSKGYESHQIPEFILQLLPLYTQILVELEQEGVEWVQLDEPILVTSITEEEMKTVAYIYEQLHEAAPKLKKLLQTYFDSVSHYEQLVELPVQGIGLDFVHGKEQNTQAIETHGFPEDKVLGVGLINGRNIWKSNLSEKLAFVESIAKHVSVEQMIIQPSSSLLHVPVTVTNEDKLDSTLKQALSFADEKLDELKLLVDGIRLGKEAIRAQLEEAESILETIAQAPFRNRVAVHEAVKSLDEKSSKRQHPFSERRVAQQERWNLPSLPITTIGSFPQTAEVRQARQKWRKGESTTEQYEQFIQNEIKKWIEIQEEIGIDVLVHGEFERTDMVEFFGEKLGGFAFTSKAWVQSYGSRCVRPPVIYGDVEFIEPMTVKESVYAQSLTDKPVKGMLTGPTTILNWSFVRDDLPRSQVAFQIALALRKEVEALESNGIQMIQVDEPALREGLPLKRSEWDEYLEWAVQAFRISTASAQDQTQIHTHMCYSEFKDIIDSIKALDADVISIETSRSHGELISSFEEHTYDQGIGLGVYDIHSPRVPRVEEMTKMIDRALRVLDPALFWVNPDCGLKTRGIEETVVSLKNMVEATDVARNKLASEVTS